MCPYGFKHNFENGCWFCPVLLEYRYVMLSQQFFLKEKKTDSWV